jgi:alanyl-tRNA synthetase
MGLDEARAGGAMALFGEKYGDVVRVVRIEDYSLELCGGTHLTTTGQMGLFRVLSEGGVSSGVRRSEAVAGLAAEKVINSERTLITDLARLLNASDSELQGRVEKLLAQNTEQEKEIHSLRRIRAGSEIETMAANGQTIDGFRVVTGRVNPKNLDDFRRMADTLREKLVSGVGILGAALDNRATFLTVVTDDLIKGRGLKAGDIVKQVAQVAGGGGGGKPHMAQAGAKDIDKLDEALSRALEIVKKQVRD